MRRQRQNTDSGVRGESGQSTIEFALTLLLIMTFFLGFTQLSLVFGYGNFVHYATFMAARAQLSAGVNTEDQTRRAQKVLTRMLKTAEGPGGRDRWPALGQAFGGQSEVRGADFGAGNQFESGDPAKSWMQGVRYTFRSRLFMIPLGGNASSNSVTLTSESWLGREPSYSDCFQELIDKGALFDNGC
jgi:hypothetical protein